MCALDVGSVQHNQGWRTVVFRGRAGKTYERVIPVRVLADLDRLRSAPRATSQGSETDSFGVRVYGRGAWGEEYCARPVLR